MKAFYLLRANILFLMTFCFISVSYADSTSLHARPSQVRPAKTWTLYKEAHRYISLDEHEKQTRGSFVVDKACPSKFSPEIQAVPVQMGKPTGGGDDAKHAIVGYGIDYLTVSTIDPKHSQVVYHAYTWYIAGRGNEKDGWMSFTIDCKPD